jgi:hypothetical protein
MVVRVVHVRRKAVRLELVTHTQFGLPLKLLRHTRDILRHTHDQA